jgi:hypothetical protein
MNLLVRLSLLVVLLRTLDALTTYTALTSRSLYQVSEANPLAAWLFSSVGLVPGLVVSEVVGVLACLFLCYTKSFTVPQRAVVLILLCVTPALAVINNLGVLQRMGVL